MSEIILFSKNQKRTNAVSNMLKQHAVTAFSEENNLTEILKKDTSVDIIIIDIECWKEYNLEQTADENIEDFNVESNSNEETNIKKKEKKNKNKVKKNNNNKENNISCTCLII